MSKRSSYGAGAVVGASSLVMQYVFDIDLGSFVWGIALMTLGFAVAFIVTPAESQEPGD